jgi:hypothetical protein
MAQAPGGALSGPQTPGTASPRYFAPSVPFHRFWAFQGRETGPFRRFWRGRG